jgi:hypothetical protein
MVGRLLCVAMGLALAGWGHLLLNNLFGARLRWRRLDARSPPAWHCPASTAGSLLLITGAACALVPALG